MCPIGRCQPCNALYNRVRNNIRRVDQWIVNAWNNTDKDNKADFIRSCRGLAGPTIRGLLRQFLYNEIQLRLPFESKFLDSPDLQSRSKEKPDHSNLILEKKISDPWNKFTTESVKRKMDFSPEDFIQPPYKQTAGAPATMTGDASKIDKKDINRLHNGWRFLKAAEERLEALNEVITGLGQWIAPVANYKLKELQNRHATLQKICDEIKLTGVWLDFARFIESMSAFKGVFNSETALIDVQIQQSLCLKMNYAPQWIEDGRLGSE